jgi:hypothetical protein
VQSRFAQENMQRILDEQEERERDRKALQQHSLWRRLVRRSSATPLTVSSAPPRPLPGDPAFGRFARENMQRILDEHAERRRSD